MTRKKKPGRSVFGLGFLQIGIEEAFVYDETTGQYFALLKGRHEDKKVQILSVDYYCTREQLWAMREGLA